MYTIADIDYYFEYIAQSLKYVNHTIGGSGLDKRYARFNDEETMTAVIKGMGFPRMILSGLPTGSMAGNSNLIQDKLSMAIEILNTCKKDDFNGEMQIWNDTRAALHQFVARIQFNKANGTCDELEKKFDFNSVRYDLTKSVDGTGIIIGCRMSFTLNSYLADYDETQWQ